MDQLLSRLWLHEPNSDSITCAVNDLGLPPADPADLAPAYADLFLLNIFPYGTVFTGDSGEMNGPDAEAVAALFEALGFHPPELNEVGAPDHLGLCLGFLPHLSRREAEAGSEGEAFFNHLLTWAPACCLAVEREPDAPPFYRALAARTCHDLLAEHAPRHSLHPVTVDLPPINLDDELTLRAIVRFCLAPARCGLFLSRARLGHMAKQLGMRLPFGSRFEVAENLFTAASEPDGLKKLLDILQGQVSVWANDYQTLAQKYPHWQPAAHLWLARLAATSRLLDGMKVTLVAEATQGIV